MNEIIKECFNKQGNFIIEGFDPYHHKPEHQWLVEILFDDNGNAYYEMIEAAKAFAKEHNCMWDSDIAQYIICSRINCFTKCNYNDVSLWR